MTRWPLAIVVGLLLAGCASVPSGPSVMALPGSAKSGDEFRSDDSACRQAAAIDAKATTKWRYDMTYLECMYAKGNQIPVRSGIFGATPGSSGSSALTTTPVLTTTPAPGTTPASSTAPGNQPAK